MAEHAGFAAAITVREHVFRVALRAGYANGSDGSKKFVEDLSADGIGMKPDLFLGPPEIDCEGATNRLVATLPMWGTVTVTRNEMSHVVSVNGAVELAISPAFTAGPAGSSTESSLVLHPINTIIDARRWTATVTSATPGDVAALVTGDEFRARFEEKFRLGFFAGRVSLPSIDASFLGPIVRKASSVSSRVRDGALMLGLSYLDATHALNGESEDLHDFAVNHDVAGVVHPAAVDILLDDLHARIVEAVAAEDATLDSFSVRARNGHFRVNGAVSKSAGTVNFSFRVVPSMFHTRPGAYFRYEFEPVRIRSRTWPALGFHLEDVETDVDRAWWVVVGEVFFGILTVGFAIVFIEGIVEATAANFGAKVKAAKSGAPVARIQRTDPPPGGIGVRIGLEMFDITESGLFVGISVQDQASPSKLLGPSVVPATYRNDMLRYVLAPPSGVVVIDPALRVQWTLEDRTNNQVLRDVDGPVEDRLRFEFSLGSFAATDFRIVARLYRQFGVADTDLATHTLNLHVRPALPSGAYVRWRWKAETPQMAVDSTSDTWAFLGKRAVFRYSEWHRTDAPCRAVNAPSRYRYEIEQADRLPFSLRLLENHRKGLCPYCFFGGPAGTNASL